MPKFSTAIQISVIIADDHAIVRGGLRQIMAMTSDLKVVGEARSGDEVLELVKGLQPDVLLLDISMPGCHGVDLVQRLKVAYPRLPILILSMHNEGQIVARMLKVGVSGYITKDAEPEILLAAVRKVAGGGRFIDPSLVDTMIFDGAHHHDSPYDLLSDRELQVLQLLVSGMPVTEVADSLHLSAKTISTHKTRLMQKLHLGSNADMVRYAIRHGLIEG